MLVTINNVLLFIGIAFLFLAFLLKVTVFKKTPQPKRESNDKISLLQWIKENKIQTYMILFLFVVLIHTKSAVCINRVSSESMESTCPELVMESEYSGITTEEERITITGKVKDYDTLTLNGHDVENISIDGYFSIDIDLHEGVNVFALSAKDKAGNETTYVMDITRVIPVEEERSLTINDILFLIGIVLLGVAFFIKKFIFDKKERSPKDPNEKISLLQWVKENKIQTCMILFLLIVFIIINFIIGINRVSSGSMEPTYMTGDFTIGYKLQYLTKDVERGDIIGFHFVDSDGEKYKVIKRVIGLPGETVSFKDGHVYINGVKLDESEYIDENMETNCIATFTVPEDSYFVLGDSRDTSYDSRYWANPYVSKKDIFEKEIYLIPVSKLRKE